MARAAGGASFVGLGQGRRQKTPPAPPPPRYGTNLPAKLGNHRTESPELAEPTPGSEQTLGERGWTQGGGGPARLSPGLPGAPSILLLEALALTAPSPRHAT